MTIDTEHLARALGKGPRNSRLIHPVDDDVCTTLTQAAVAVVLDVDDAAVLFIKRTEHPDDPWSGHMAFPGGKHDDGDASLMDTVIRETREELSIDLMDVARSLGQLTPIRPARRATRHICATPFVFAVVDMPALRRQLQPNHEVAEVVWIPIGHLLDSDNVSADTVEFDGATSVWHSYTYREYVIWGLSGEILFELLSALPSS